MVLISLVLTSDVEDTNEDLLRQLSYAIKNQQKAQNAPHVEGFLHALSWFFMA